MPKWISDYSKRYGNETDKTDKSINVSSVSSMDKGFQTKQTREESFPDGVLVTIFSEVLDDHFILKSEGTKVGDSNPKEYCVYTDTECSQLLKAGLSKKELKQAHEIKKALSPQHPMVVEPNALEKGKNLKGFPTPKKGGGN